LRLRETAPHRVIGFAAVAFPTHICAIASLHFYIR